MVRTTKGPVQAPKDPAPTPPPITEKLQRDLDLDDATWGRIQTMALSQQSSIDDVIKRAIEAQFGSDQPTEPFNAR